MIILWLWDDFRNPDDFWMTLVDCNDFGMYSSNQITKKETKSEDRLLKFDWNDLSPIFLAIMLLHNLKVFKKPIKDHLLAFHWYNRPDQILTCDHQMLIWFLVI